MPIVTVTVCAPKSGEFKSSVLDAVHSALVNAGVNEHDRFQRVLELPEGDFLFDLKFPDLQTTRTNDFVLVEVLLGVGRSVRVKKRILEDVKSGFAAAGHDPENLMVVFQDVPWENCSPAGGRVPYA